MESSLSLKIDISINASAANIWNALTNPDLVKKYFFGTNIESDWEKGSTIYFRGEWEGNKYEDKGVIIDIVPEKFIKYNYWGSMSGTPDLPENYAEITYSLSQKQKHTILTITQNGIKNEEAKKHSEENWVMVMNGMKNIVETQ
jgi:uncharacterized protein YndB with AHSA1/START domain